MSSISPLGALGTGNALSIQQYANRASLLMTGNIYYCNPSGGGGQDGLTPATGFQNLIDAYNKCTAGNNDVVVLVGNGASSGSARISAKFTWAKDATHLVGVCAPSLVSQRARIAPPTSATAFAGFFEVSGNGCLLQNISWFQGFGTGTTAEICMKVSGQRNAFINCDFEGMGDTTGATDAGSRNILITGGENYFGHCNVGLDTVERTNANASVEIQSGAARTVFEACTFLVWSSDGLQYFLLANAAAAFDRFVMFRGCNLISAVGSTGTAIALAFKAAASSGGIIVFDATSGLFGVTAIGDATTKAQTYVSGGTATNGVKGVVAT